MKRLYIALAFILAASLLQAQQYYNQLKPLLIDLPGWNADSPQGMDASFNNTYMITATREYTRGDATLEGSVLIGQAASSYDIPKVSYETDEGFLRSEKIKNYPLYISYDKSDKSGAIFIVLTASPQSAIFVLTYQNTDWQTALDLAKKFDWDAMKKIALEVK